MRFYLFVIISLIALALGVFGETSTQHEEVCGVLVFVDLSVDTRQSAQVLAEVFAFGNLEMAPVMAPITPGGIGEAVDTYSQF